MKDNADKPSAFRSTWQNPPSADEIKRQEEMKRRLTPGLRVRLKGLGDFTYAGIWDTMHTFYPAEDQQLHEVVSGQRRRYLKRDLRGIWFIRLPYTLLADEIIIPES